MLVGACMVASEIGCASSSEGYGTATQQAGPCAEPFCPRAMSILALDWARSKQKHRDLKSEVAAREAKTRHRLPMMTAE